MQVGSSKDLDKKATEWEEALNRFANKKAVSSSSSLQEQVSFFPKTEAAAKVNALALVPDSPKPNFHNMTSGTGAY